VDDVSDNPISHPILIDGTINRCSNIYGGADVSSYIFACRYNTHSNSNTSVSSNVGADVSSNIITTWCVASPDVGTIHTNANNITDIITTWYVSPIVSSYIVARWCNT
jgi:hypothetical protein